VTDGLRIGFETIAAGSTLEAGSGGAPGYFHALIPRLRDDPRVEHLTLFVPDWYERAAEWEHPKATVVRCRVPKARPLRVAYEQLALPRQANRARIDCLISPSNYRPLRYRPPNVLVLHAIQYFLLGDDIGRMRSAYLKFAVPRSVRTADRTVTVTETLREDAIRLFGADAERLVAVHMGAQPWVAELVESGREFEAEPYRPGDGSPYVLSISRLYALKNHARLIRAFARLCREREVPHKLLIVGGEADLTIADLETVAREAGVADRAIFLGRVEQEMVDGLYAGASAIAYVSLYETFGHPVLEAFATGTPLLTSTTGATAEVAGGAARLVDPEDEADIAAGLGDVLFDEKLRERLVADGLERVREFSWDACARGTLDAVEAALERRRSNGAAP
jgi:glycosyltransferase involved in cell wall biosynthesis